MDKIYIRDLKASTIIGTLPNERVECQEVILNIELACNLAKAGRTDALEDTIDYSAIRDAVLSYAEASSFKLLEALAEGVANICLAFAGVKSVKVAIDKPKALPSARSVAIEIERP
jgi:FolB domain-containing protein